MCLISFSCFFVFLFFFRANRLQEQRGMNSWQQTVEMFVFYIRNWHAEYFLKELLHSTVGSHQC